MIPEPNNLAKAGHLQAAGLSSTPVIGSLGSLTTRLAQTDEEIRAVQSLRYEVFYEELSAKLSSPRQLGGLDNDAFDHICDHLMVLDKTEDREFVPKSVVGTYRLLRQEVAERHMGFYSAGAFDLDPLLSRHGNMRFLELGRSCVRPTFRNKRTIELMWHGTWSYTLQYNIDVMIGCASFQGTNIETLKEPLSFLHHSFRVSSKWSVLAHSGIGVDMNIVPAEMIDHRRAFRALPPMIKGYLRLGAMVSGQAVVDEQFGTTDVLIILPVNKINPKYINYYGASAERHRGVA